MDKLIDQLKAIVFDFDGTLVDSVKIKLDAFTDMFSQFGPEVFKQVQVYQKVHGGISRYTKFRYLYKELLNKNLSEKEVQELSAEFTRRIETLVTETAYISGAKEFLEGHGSKLKLFVASATPQPELDRIIKNRGMSRYFEKVFGTPTTKVKAIEEVLSQYGFTAKEICMVGDTISDAEAALATKCHFVAIVGDGKPFSHAVAQINNLMQIQEVTF